MNLEGVKAVSNDGDYESADGETRLIKFRAQGIDVLIDENYISLENRALGGGEIYGFAYVKGKELPPPAYTGPNNRFQDVKSVLATLKAMKVFV